MPPSIEPELLAPAPRPVIRRPDTPYFARIAGLRVLTLLVLMAALVLFALAAAASFGGPRSVPASSPPSAYWIGGLICLTVFLAGVQETVIGPRLMERLVAEGRPTLGTISRKTEDDGEGPVRYELHYEYFPEGRPLAAAPVRWKMRVERGVWESLQPGERVTVLYLAEKPQSSALYAWASFMVGG